MYEHMLTPEQQERAEAEASPHYTYDNGNPKMHRHTFSWTVHRDDECHIGVRENGEWTTSRRRVYVFDDDYLDEHERFISERVWSEAYQDGWSDRAHPGENRARNPYRKEQ